MKNTIMLLIGAVTLGGCATYEATHFDIGYMKFEVEIPHIVFQTSPSGSTMTVTTNDEHPEEFQFIGCKQYNVIGPETQCYWISNKINERIYISYTSDDQMFHVVADNYVTGEEFYRYAFEKNHEFIH